MLPIYGPGYRCGTSVQRRGLHPADRGPEGSESDGGVPDHEPGVSGICAGGTFDSASDPERSRGAWMRTDVRGNCAGAAAPAGKGILVSVQCKAFVNCTAIFLQYEK